MHNAITETLKNLLDSSVAQSRDNWAQATLETRSDVAAAANDQSYAQPFAHLVHRRAKKGAITARKRPIANNRCQNRPSPQFRLSHCSGWGFYAVSPVNPVTN